MGIYCANGENTPRSLNDQSSLDFTLSFKNGSCSVIPIIIDLKDFEPFPFKEILFVGFVK